MAKKEKKTYGPGDVEQPMLPLVAGDHKDVSVAKLLLRHQSFTFIVKGLGLHWWWAVPWM